GWNWSPRFRAGVLSRCAAAGSRQPLWLADEVGGHRPQQERAGPGPPGGRSGRDDNAGAGSSLDQAGNLLVVVAADPGHVVVDDARPGPARDLAPRGGGGPAGRRRVIGAEQPEPERGPALQPLASLPWGGVEVELGCAAGAEPGRGHRVRVPREPPQRRRVGQYGGGRPRRRPPPPRPARPPAP